MRWPAISLSIHSSIISKRDGFRNGMEFSSEKKINYREWTSTSSFTAGDSFSFGSTTMRIIYTPGHAIGHCCLYFPTDEILNLGDIDLGPFGPWSGDGVSGIDETINSIDKVLTIPARAFISSHETGIIGGNIIVPAERYRAVINQRKTALLDFLEKP